MLMSSSVSFFGAFLVEVAGCVIWPKMQNTR